MAAAVALRQIGIEPLVLEQAQALTEIGAGINLWPNAMRALHQLGAADHIRATGVRGEKVVHLDLASGAELESLPFGPTARSYGEDLYNSHRADLLDALIDRLDGADVKVASRVVGFRQDEAGVEVTLEGGEELTGDFLVGADGLKSAVRAQLFGAEEPQYTGVAAWRALLPRDRADGVAVVQGIASWFGANRTVVVYPVRRGELVSFSGYVPDDEVRNESWTSAGDLDDLRRSFAIACPEITDLIAQVDRAIITPIYYRRPLENWAQGRVVLVGDAAHPIPPFAGQGAALAVEDAVALAEALRAQDDVSAALQDFAARRGPRAEQVLVRSQANLVQYRQSDPVQACARNGRIRGLKRLDPRAESTSAWLYGYDATVRKPDPAVDRLAQWPAHARRAHELWRTVFTVEDRAASWLGERPAYERFLLAHSPGVDGQRVEEVDCAGVPALRVVPPGGENGPAILHLHGGGYVMGSARASAGYAARLAAAVGGWALVPDYRLAPEHGYPAALDDVLTAYRWLLDREGVPSCISGECAGGGLAVALSVALAGGDDRQPGALHLLSPFCDLAVTGPGPDAPLDAWYSRAKLLGLAASYVQDADSDDGLVSPVAADLRGLPPMHIEVARDEALHDSATLLAERARAAGVPVELEVVPDTVHAFALFPDLPEADAAIERFTALAATPALTPPSGG
jgi:salicylate hydroxylase